MKAIAAKIENAVLAFPTISKLDYEHSYSVSSLILIFFSFSFVGWVWEVVLHIFSDGMFINRGFLPGPWLPVYGAGGVLILILLRKWRRNPLQLSGMIMVVCGIIEYVTSMMLERLFGAKWWDYSSLPFNIDGRVCLGGLLIFAVGGLFLTYFAAPKADNLLCRLSRETKWVACGFLLLVFTEDLIHAFIAPNMGFGITY